MENRLYKSRENKMISGVCGGIAEKLNVDPTIIRLVWAASIIFYGIGLLPYIAAAIIIPYKPINTDNKDDDLK